ncbi:MAG: acyl-[acyl-carrier-protein]--UDP-N-acetylglucosamine O-acyltransferase, partial [Methylococcaceae bacterium]|nr:acyl-[acyl-carrier-protein]--UDP-N-acetylglucosamine O-acyltransferase [Methylococcaceae bacterium]
GSYARLQGLAVINKDVLPYLMVGGRPGKHYRRNLIGLRRAGIDGERLKAGSAARRRPKGQRGLEGLPDTPELDYVRSWLAAGSKRGILPFVDIHREAD